MKKFFLLLAFSVCLFIGCASGTHLITGTVRPPISIENVKVYHQFPEKYEIIGIVTGESGDGWTEQGDLDLALKEARRQASLIGANGIVLENIGTNNEMYLISGMLVSGTSKRIQATAIYVE